MPLCVDDGVIADIGIVLDHSTSIVARGGYPSWTIVLGFVTQLINAFPIGPRLTRVGVVGFSNKAWLQFGFSRYHNARQMIYAVQHTSIRGGETNFAQVRA